MKSFKPWWRQSGFRSRSKIRSGWDSDSINAVEIALLAEKAGAAAITLHGRTRDQFYSGEADWGGHSAASKRP